MKVPRGAVGLGFLAGFALLVIAVGPAAGQSGSSGKVVLQGAGATFPAPLYKKWIGVFTAQNPDVVGRVQGRRQRGGRPRFLAQTVDFGASDGALTDEQMARVANGARLVPATAGMVVLAYNLPGRRRRTEAQPRRVRRHLSPEDREVERSADPGHQPRA